MVQKGATSVLQTIHFIIFGWPKKIKDRGAAYPANCPHCHNSSYWRLLKTRRWISFFFIPMIPLGRASYHLYCPVCEVNIDVTRSDASVLKDLKSSTDEFRKGKLSENEYEQRVSKAESKIWKTDKDSEIAVDYEHARNNEPAEVAVDKSAGAPLEENPSSQQQATAASEGQAKQETEAVRLSKTSIGDVLSPKERRSVKAAIDKLSGEEATTKRTLQKAYDTYPAEYHSQEDWWNELITPVFEEHPEIEKLDSSGLRWQLNS
jgi:hypothetical protein